MLGLHQVRFVMGPSSCCAAIGSSFHTAGCLRLVCSTEQSAAHVLVGHAKVAIVSMLVPSCLSGIGNVGEKDQVAGKLDHAEMDGVGRKQSDSEEGREEMGTKTCTEDNAALKALEYAAILMQCSKGTLS